MSEYNSIHTGQEIDQYSTASNIINLIYPVGSIYISVNSTSPTTLFGGTWEQIQGQFLLGCNSTYTAGSTGGSASHVHSTSNHTLTVKETPKHNHAIFIFNANNTNYDAARANGSGGWTTATSGGRLPSGYMSWNSSAFKTAGSNYTNIGTGDFAGNTDIIGGGAGHNHGNTGSTSTLPPYLAVYIWKRIA